MAYKTGGSSRCFAQTHLREIPNGSIRARSSPQEMTDIALEAGRIEEPVILMDSVVI